MKNKFELFDELPQELQIETTPSLSNRELVNLAQTSKYHLALFKPMIDVHKLLYHVTHGEHEAVKVMLEGDMSLIYKRGKVTDCSGRVFDNISAFEYALWALDKHMWAKMIACIPHNEEGRKVFAKLIAQYNKVNTDGVTYRLNGKTITEQHFDFKNTLIKELQTQVNSLNAPGIQDWDAIDKQWREGVGGAQKLLPMHVVYEYCSNEPFYPVPKFTSQPKSLKKFYNSTTKKAEDWFSADSKLGSEFAVYRGGASHWASVMSSSLGSPDDLVAVKTLYEVRTQDFIDLKSQLEEQMSLDNDHHAVRPMLTAWR
ncbi:hypothetical protein [Legionella pneumophila]|uniref:SidC homolog n=1 Tax=Legionella pneumophila subsp. pascullei TaxID=91890 RepID=A0AAX2IRV4_LEGPN|nr:hypothetical protein [Legionella pneumophila]AMP88263.1 hypothetical protein AXF35_00495 [Legionella pneumophila subsp. pascullei]AMP91172.1 hypothetical protein AXF36_00495 [Legionella pneumophila subsp. pascullei]AMP94159.1 hypothetical protein AXF37_00495 [Legionella pneumophila subsp. pascullei]SQG88932.1 SidC homolog [Legionella pneumophila subsp. pascullei]VEH03982.1 SidC homolog [Legionella pneumophila subsp. pascullei]